MLQFWLSSMQAVSCLSLDAGSKDAGTAAAGCSAYAICTQRVRLKNLIQSILHTHLIPPCPHGNLTGISGRKWLAPQPLPLDERQAVDRHLGQIDQIEQSLKIAQMPTLRSAPCKIH
jgi:hypothetical protein